VGGEVGEAGMELPAPSVPLRRRNERGREEAGREGEEEEEEEEEE